MLRPALALVLLAIPAVASAQIRITVVRFRSPELEIKLAGRGESGARSRVPFGGSN